MELEIAVPPGELVDKVTILEIKLERIKDAAKLRNIAHEYAVLAATMKDKIAETPALAALRADLKRANEAIWQAEEDVRAFERRQDFGRPFVEAARSVYFNNDRRAELKRRINEMFGSKLIEEKSHDPY